MCYSSYNIAYIVVDIIYNLYYWYSSIRNYFIKVFHIKKVNKDMKRIKDLSCLDDVIILDKNNNRIKATIFDITKDYINVVSSSREYHFRISDINDTKVHWMGYTLLCE